MSAYIFAKEARRAAANNTPEARIARNQCPVCPGNLDTGYECNECGYDAMPEALSASNAAQVSK